MIAQALSAPTRGIAQRARALTVLTDHRQTLSSFVAGLENTAALAVVHACARRPGTITPLLVTGGAGMGKTHLLKGLTYVLQNYSMAPERVLYVSGESFARRVQMHIHKGTMMRFRQFHRGLDALIVDDLSGLLEKTNPAIHELSYLLDAFAERNATLQHKVQVVVADRHLSALLPKLPQQLSPLLQAPRGTPMVRLAPPSQQTLVTLCQGAAAARGLTLDTYDRARLVDVVLAGGPPPGGPVRMLLFELERLAESYAVAPTGTTLHDLVTRQINVPLRANGAPYKRQHASAAGRSPGTADAIVTETAHYFGIPVATIISKKRDPWTVQARQIAMYLLCEDAGLGVSHIGRLLGRDHSTVIHGHRQVAEALVRGDKEIDETVRDIRTLLTRRTLERAVS